MSIAAPRVETTVERLVTLGTRSDDVADLLTFLWSGLRRPMVVADPHGAALASSPVGAPGREVLEALLAGESETAWEILALRLRRTPLGYLVLGTEPALSPDERALVEVARPLLADQLHRASMAARIVDERRSTLKRRIIGETEPTPADLAAASERAGMTLASHYWPTILTSERADIGSGLLADIEDFVVQDGAEHVVIRRDARTVVVLVAADAAGVVGEAAARSLVERVIALAGARGHAMQLHALLAEASVPLADVAVRVDSLCDLSAHVEHRDTSAERHVYSEKSLAVLGLLQAVDRRRATAFVVSQIGALLAYDRAYAADLTDILEMALDMPNRADAAKAAYMHRNTFRRHVRHALELIDHDLDDPDERLTLHVALKLSNVLGLRRHPDPVRAAPRGLTRHGGWSETPVRPRGAG